MRSLHVSAGIDLTIGPKIANPASRRSECDERHHVIEMRRRFPHGRLWAVMMEQLEFLLLHVRTGRHLACSECARLYRIGSVLLAPFL